MVTRAQAGGEACHRGQGDAEAAEGGHGQDEGQGGVPLSRLQPPAPRAGQSAPGREDVCRERGSGGVPQGGAGARMDHQNFGHISDRLGPLLHVLEKVTKT